MNPAIIIAAISGLESLIEFVMKVKSNAAQTAAWTPAERAEVDAKWDTLMQSEAWKTDADRL